MIFVWPNFSNKMWMPEDKFWSKKESPSFKTMLSSFSILTMILKKASNSVDEDCIFAAWRASFNLSGKENHWNIFKHIFMYASKTLITLLYFNVYLRVCVCQCFHSGLIYLVWRANCYTWKINLPYRIVRRLQRCQDGLN